MLSIPLHSANVFKPRVALCLSAKTRRLVSVIIIAQFRCANRVQRACINTFVEDRIVENQPNSWDLLITLINKSISGANPLPRLFRYNKLPLIHYLNMDNICIFFKSACNLKCLTVSSKMVNNTGNFGGNCKMHTNSSSLQLQVNIGQANDVYRDHILMLAGC